MCEGFEDSSSSLGFVLESLIKSMKLLHATPTASLACGLY